MKLVVQIAAGILLAIGIAIAGFNYAAEKALQEVRAQEIAAQKKAREIHTAKILPSGASRAC